MVEKISLVIPVYNKAKFLTRCLKSVIENKTGQLQVILVDDGSDDGSASICDVYGKDFEVYHLDHEGVSAARNFGIEKSRGEYVTFLDADDFLAKNAIRNMIRASETGYNIYQFGQYRLRNCVSFDERLILPHKSPEGRYTLDYIPRYWVHVWNKMYKKSFLDDNKIRFRPGMQFGEDAIFNAECLLANNGFYHTLYSTVYHVLDDPDSLCRGSGLTLARVELLDDELVKLYNSHSMPAKKKWLMQAINQHRHSKLFRRLGFTTCFKGSYDVVYLLKESSMNPELVYSLRSLEENWPYKSVWFAGGCPEGLKPDHYMKIKQVGLNKWEKVRNMLIKVCQNDEITEDFWLFNDDFFVLKPIDENMAPQYNGTLISYVERIEKKQGGADEFTVRVRQANDDLLAAGYTNLNYEVHKPMLFNRRKLLEVLEKFPNTPGVRSLYGNYWRVGGRSRHDMKIKISNFTRLEVLGTEWEFVSTSDESFRNGNVGEWIRNRFTDKRRFE